MEALHDLGGQKPDSPAKMVLMSIRTESSHCDSIERLITVDLLAARASTAEPQSGAAFHQGT